jgi:uncharacterized membrane protein YhaH (DUF805 family)
MDAKPLPEEIQQLLAAVIAGEITEDEPDVRLAYAAHPGLRDEVASLRTLSAQLSFCARRVRRRNRNARLLLLISVVLAGAIVAWRWL